MPQVSVVMPVYNGERYLAEAIESILAQTFTDFEFIIVDDGSTDGSAEIVQTFAERDSRIRFLQLAENRGRADARNAGIKSAHGNYIAMMDCDDLCLRKRLSMQADFIQSNPDIGVVGTCGQVMNRDMTAPQSEFKLPGEHALIALYTFLGYGILGASLMFRRECLTQAGGYEAGRRFCDDLELHWRILQDTRIRFANLPDQLYLYRRHDQPKFRNTRTDPYLEWRRLKRLNLKRLGIREPDATLQRLAQLRPFNRLSWAERRLAKRDLRRIINGMVAQEWVEPGDRPLLVAEMNRLLERASPRLWQMFCHWYRHRIKRHLPAFKR